MHWATMDLVIEWRAREGRSDLPVPKRTYKTHLADPQADYTRLVDLLIMYHDDVYHKSHGNANFLSTH